VLLALLLAQPDLIERIADRLVAVDFVTTGFDAVRQALLNVAATHETLDRESLHRHLSDHGLAEIVGRIEGDPGARSADPLTHVVNVDEAESLWQHTFDLHQRQHWDAELAADFAAFAENPTDEAWQRLKAKQELKQATEARLVEIDPPVHSAGERS
jgi:hypothetical protein